MPIVDGQYQAKISTVFARVSDGIRALKDKIDGARKVRISNIQGGLLNKLLPGLKGKDVKIILPGGVEPTAKLREVGEVAVQKARIYSDFKGVEANEGSVYFSDVMFCITWSKDKVLQIATMEYDKCVKCMRGTFEMAWRYSDKQK